MNAEKENKLNDIGNIQFGTKPEEVISTLDILLMMYEFDDDPEIIAACKQQMQKGIQILKKMNLSTQDYQIEA